MPQRRLLIVGYLSIDTVTDPDGRAARAPGGAALYAALGACRAGAAVDLAASVGSDFPAVWLRALEAEGIGLQHVEHKPAPTRWAHIRHHADGRRESTHYGDPAWWASSERHAPSWPSDVSGYGQVVAGPMAVTRLARLMETARDAGVPVVADTNEAFAAAGGARWLTLLKNCDIFAPSVEETRILFPGLGDDEAAHALAGRGPALVQKRGAEGLFVVEKGGGHAWRLPALAARIVDPTGAGDATVGALAAGRLQGQSLFDAAQAALPVGALAVSGVGPSALCPALPQSAAPACASTGA